MATAQLGAMDLGVTDPRQNVSSKEDSSRRTLGPVIATASGTGSTTTLAVTAPASGVNAVRVGEKGCVFSSAGVVKDNWRVVVVTGVNAGGTVITFAPALSGATATGDVFRSTSPDSYSDNDGMDARLLAIGGIFTQKYIDSMTQNDKLYALRLNDDATSIY